MSVNKVQYNDNGQLKTLIDLTADTVTADKLAKGYTAHDMSGNIITGTLESSGGSSDEAKRILDSTLIGEYVAPITGSEVKTYIFANNKNLTKLTFAYPNNIKYIRNYAFYGCSKLSDFTIPVNVETIGEYAFSNCTALKTVSIPPKVTTIYRCTFRYDDSDGVSGLSSISLGNVKNIHEDAFRGCALTQLELPSTVETINKTAFSGCKSLTHVTFKGTPRSINTTTFNSCPALTDIYVPWSEGAVSGAPWGATNATIHYNYTTT